MAKKGFMPYEGLPVEQRVKDYLFGGIVKSFFEANRLGNDAATAS